LAVDRRLNWWSVTLLRIAQLPTSIRWGGMWCVVFVAIALNRSAIIDSPPYYDFATGLFLEANFLAETNFDYSKLVHEQHRWMEGGAAVYITSVMPTFVAALMRWLPSARAVLVAYHLFTFAAAATLALLVFAAIRSRTGVWGAAVTALCLLTVPLLSTQIDMCGMDLPMAVLAVAAVLLIAKGHYEWSAVAGAGAFLIKTPGRAVIAATIIYLVGLLVLGRGLAPSAERRRLWRGLGWHLLVFAAEIAAIDWTNSLPHSEIETWTQSRRYFRGENYWDWLPYWFPDQLAVFAVCLISLLCAAGWVLRLQFRENAGSWFNRLRRSVYQLLVAEPLIVVGWTIIFGMLTALWFVYCLPRYFILILPFLYLTLGLLLFSRPRLRGFGLVVVSALVVFNLANMNGAFFPAIDRAPHDALRTGAMLERSREYLRDHQSNIAGMSKLASSHPDASIIAPSPYVHFLSLPRLGYVDRPLQGFSLSRYHAGTFKSGLELPKQAPRNVVFVRVRNSFATGEVPAPEPSDEMIWNDRNVNPRSPLEIFRRSWPTTVAAAELAERYLMIVVPSRGLVERGHIAAREGRFDDARKFYLDALAAGASQPDSPVQVDVRMGLAVISFQQRQWPAVVENLRIVTKLDPQRASAFDLLGRALAELGVWDEAAESFRGAVRLDPANLVAWKGLANAELRRRHYAAAAAALDNAARLTPDDADLFYLLGAARQQAGDLSGAIAAYDRALVLRTDWAAAKNDLAWLLATSAEDELRNPARAVQLAESACEASFRQGASMLDTLAAAYAANGQFVQAVAVAREAIERAKEDPQDHLAPEIATRLAQYERGEAYRAPPILPTKSAVPSPPRAE
jgi:tetratricopeptide (TPR) repeat protein